MTHASSLPALCGRMWIGLHAACKLRSAKCLRPALGMRIGSERCCQPALGAWGFACPMAQAR
eukprot:1577116-Lingulodinium_polyedra.AAC.1